MEKMTDFFTARVDIYDDHMIHEVEGCREGYLKMAELVPEKTKTLLDLGCGTGLERLKKKYSDRDVTLIEADYMACELGTERYDAAVSFQTLHHFTHEEKLGLYEKLWRALKAGGCYIECDYMAETQEQEDYFVAEKKRLEEELKLVKGEYYHFDMPCTMDNQKRLLRQAGFTEVEVVWRQENTTILYANR